MATFLAINTSSVTIIPATVIAIRVSSGATSPTEIIGPTIVATLVSTVVGVTAAKLLAKVSKPQIPLEPAVLENDSEIEPGESSSSTEEDAS